MNIILLSGGSGKRLWPLSNEVRSKQFLKIFKKADGSHESMVQRMYRMICEMFSFYKTRGVSLPQKLDEIYSTYGYCLNTLHSYEFPGSTGMEKMNQIMGEFHKGLTEIAGMQVVRTEDYLPGLNGLPKSDVLKFFTKTGSVVVRPSGTEPKLKLYISVTAPDRTGAEEVEKRIIVDLAKKL